MKTRAIILKKQDVNEYDQLVICYTEELGKVTAIAKGILRPKSIQSMHLDLFNLVEFELVAGRAMPIITGAQAEELHLKLKKNLKCLAVAYSFADAADKIFFEHQKDVKLWNFFDSLLKELDMTPEDMRSFMQVKQVDFMDILGYGTGSSGYTAYGALAQRKMYSLNFFDLVMDLGVEV